MFKKIRNFINLIGNAFIWQPLRGDNGRTQPDELAKWLITWIGIWMVYYEGVTEGEQYSDSKFLYVFGAVTVIAGLKMYFKKEKNIKN